MDTFRSDIDTRKLINIRIAVNETRHYEWLCWALLCFEKMLKSWVDRKFHTLLCISEESKHPHKTQIHDIVSRTPQNL